MYKIVLILFFSISLYAQQGVGINTTSPQSTLDIAKNSNVPNTQPQGVIFPRMTTEERDRMQSPIPSGLMIYNTTTKIINLYNGSVWVDFTGTPIENAVINRSNNIDVATEGRVGINTSSPQATLDIKIDINAPQNQVQGVLFPQLTTEERDRMPQPVPTGLMIYNKTTNTVDLYNGTAWVSLNSVNNSESPVKPPVLPINFRNLRTWFYGISSPPFPENESEVPHYGRNRNDSGYWVKDGIDNLGEIRWTPGCGWYDVNKQSFEKKGKDNYHYDYNLCWAATASNMLHWWVANNTANIEKYYEKYPNEKRIPSPEYRPEIYSSIFDLFRTTFYDNLSWASSAVNWFISGDKANLPAMRDDSMNDFPGYFSKVFKGKSLTKDSNRWPKKEEFNRIIKDAIENHKALGFVINISGYGAHAMTIWGAEFDDEGNVSYIYYSDNNVYNEGDDTTGVCLRRKVVYDEMGQTYYLPRNNPNHKNLIIALMALDLGTKEWQTLN